MLFPREKMEITTVYQGKESEEGWLVLDFTKIDTEGLTRIYVDLADVHKLKAKKGEQADILKKTLDMLSLDDE